MFLQLLFVCVYVCNGSTESPNVSQNTTNDSKTTLYLLSLLPYPDPVNPPSWSEGPSLAVAGQLAVDLINKMDDIFPNYHLELVIGDSGCESVSKIALATGRHALDEDKAITGILGPGCFVSAQFVASLISHKLANLVNIHIADSIPLSDRHTYPNTFGTLDSTQVFVDTLLTLAHQNNWEKIVFVYDESLKSSFFTLGALKKRIKSGNETLKIVSSLAAHDTYIPSREIKNYTSSSRVIVLLVGVDLFGKILCVGYHEGILYDSFQWIVVGRMLNDISPLNFMYRGVKYSCDEEEIVQVTNKSIFINYIIRPFNVSEPTVSGLSYTQFIDYYSELIGIQNEKLEKGEKVLEMSYWSSAYFDAVWSLALALNNSRVEIKNKIGLELSEYRYGNSVATDVIKENLFKLNYKGISGQIKFADSTGFVQRDVYIYQVMNNTMTPVQYFNGTNIFQLGNTSLEYINASFDLAIVEAPFALGIFFLLVSITGSLLLLATQVSVIIYHNSPSVKASSTPLLHVSLIGCYLINLSCFIYIFAYSFTPTPKTKCNLLHVMNIAFISGVTLIFASLSAKTWRIYRIFVHYMNPGPFINNRVLFSYIVALMSIETLVLIAFTIFERQSPTKYVFQDVAMILHRCMTPNFLVWFSILAIYNSCIMLLTLVLALLCQRIPNPNFKTKSTIFLVYILIIDLLLGAPLYLAIPLSANIVPEYLIFNMSLNVVLYACLVCLFWIPLFPVFKELAVCNKSKVRTKSKVNFSERKT